MSDTKSNQHVNKLKTSATEIHEVLWKLMPINVCPMPQHSEGAKSSHYSKVEAMQTKVASLKEWIYEMF